MKKNFFIIIFFIFGLTQNSFAYSSDPKQFIQEIVDEAKKVLVNSNTKEFKTEKLSDPTAHAEIIAIRAAAKKLGDWRLDGHVIFTTIQPCEMCMGAIIEARMEEIYYGSTNTKKKNETKLVKSQLIKHTECTNLLKEFFKDLR